MLHVPQANSASIPTTSAVHPPACPGLLASPQLPQHAQGPHLAHSITHHGYEVPHPKMQQSHTWVQRLHVPADVEAATAMPASLSAHADPTNIRRSSLMILLHTHSSAAAQK
jgi:hypothetical protein